MITRLTESIVAARANPRPGIIKALLESDICGRSVTNEDISGALTLLLGGGFDTTTSLTAHALEWMSENPGERARLRGEPGRADRLGDRGVPALLHTRPRRRAHRDQGLRAVGQEARGGRPAVAVVGDGQPRPVGVPRRGPYTISTASTTATPASVWGFTAASARTWPGPSSRSCSPRCWIACPTTSAILPAPSTTTPSG